MHYAEFMTGGASFEDKVPVIVAVHGLGDSPQGFAGLLRDFEVPARVLLPRGIDAYQEGWSWFPLRARDPNVDSLAQGIAGAAQVISEGMQAFAQTHPEAEPFVLTGFSQGGMLTFALTVQHPEQVSSAVAVGGWLPPPLWPKTAPEAAPKLVALHGMDDPAVKFPPTEAAVESLKTAGWPVELHAYRGVRHAIPPLMREELFTLLNAATKARAAQLAVPGDAGSTP